LPGQTKALHVDQLMRVNRDGNYHLAQAYAAQSTAPLHNVTQERPFTFPIPLQQRLLKTANWYRDNQWL